MDSVPTMKTRLEYMDLLKCFAIFSVLLGHATEQLSGGLFWDHPLWEFIYSYHMPLFMFVCGFFFPSSLKRSYGKMALTKLRQLGIPSLTAFAISCAIMLAAGVTAIADLCELSFAGFLNSVWFLKCLLLCYLVMHPLCRFLKKDWVAAIVATVLVIVIPGTEVVNFNFMLPMFCLGMAGTMTFFLLAKPVYDKIRDKRWCGTLCRIGGATLGIYFLQTFLLEILVNSLHIYVPIPHSYWAAPLLALAELAVCYNLVRLLSKTRLPRLLILGEKTE